MRGREKESYYLERGLPGYQTLYKELRVSAHLILTLKKGVVALSLLRGGKGTSKGQSHRPMTCSQKEGCERGRPTLGLPPGLLVHGGGPRVRGTHGGQTLLPWVGSPSLSYQSTCHSYMARTQSAGPGNRQETFPKQPLLSSCLLALQTQARSVPSTSPASTLLSQDSATWDRSLPTGHWEALKGRWLGFQSHP